MAGNNYGTTFVETFGTTSPVSGSAPTTAEDGQPLSGLGAITVVASSAAGTTLSGAGTLVAYMYDPAVLSPNGTGEAASEPDLKLNYDNQTVNFVLETIVHGVTSGAAAEISADTDSGASGTLTLVDATGTIVDNEPLAVTYATAAGTLLPALAVALAFDGQTGDFTLGQVVTGTTSGATGTLVAQTDAGATGTLYLTGVVGTFEDNEAITDPITGAAVVNGTAASSPVAYLKYDGQSGDFTANLVVTGGTSAATGIITADTDAGATGTLTLVAVTGTFVNDETLTDSGTGAAVVNLTQYKTLAYDAQVTNFIAAQVVHGLTSGATGTIQADTDAGTTGTLDLKLITGAFVDNEPIAVQFALANGALYQVFDTANVSPAFEVGQVVTGASSGASGTISAISSDELTVTGTGSTLFEDEESLVGVSQPRWLPLPSANFSVTGTGRDQAFDPVVVETPRRGARIKWVPSSVTFSAGSGGITTHQLGYAPGSNFTTGPTGGR